VAVAVAVALALALALAGCASGRIDTLDSSRLSLQQDAFGGVPLLDISRDSGVQVIVDREPGQYLGHPTTVLLEDGRTILAVYPKGHGKGPIVYKRSGDGGRTWSGRLPTPENWITSQEVPTLYRAVAPDGTRRLVMFSGLFPIRRAYSDDDGLTWSPLEPIGDFGGIVAMASLERVRDGQYMALFHDDGRFLKNEGVRSTFTVFKTLSRDGGLTWSDPVVVTKADSVDLCEPGLVRSPDGSEIALLLRENSRTRNSHVVFSRDEGETWSDPRELPAAITGDRHTAVYLPDGRLFVAFRDMGYGSETKGDWLAWVGTYEDIVAGRPGQYRVRIMDNKNAWDSTYPGVVVLPDGTVVTTTYGHWTEGEEPYIVSVRLRIEDLDRHVGLQ
jgi:hypothetical protein